MKELITKEIEGIVSDIEEAFYDIPFENSAFQNVNFVVNQQLTPARAYRAIGLRLSAKLRALKEVYFSRQLEEIDLAELEEKRDNANTSKFDKQRTEIEIQKKLSNRNYTNKLINDAVVEVQTLYKEFKNLPRYSRSEFEQEEKQHFQIRLEQQLRGITGASEALLAMQKGSVTEAAALTVKKAAALADSRKQQQQEQQQSIEDLASPSQTL